MSVVLASTAAVGTTDWFILEALLLVESLFALSESEFCAAIFAKNHFVRHGCIPPDNFRIKE
jgi:hypothetical protein